MQIEELKGIIADQRAELEDKFRKERIIEREKVGHAKKFLKYPNILAVLGVRRCGKSIFSVLLAREAGGNFGCVNFDDERLVGIRAKDLNKILQAFFFFKQKTAYEIA